MTQECGRKCSLNILKGPDGREKPDHTHNNIILCPHFQQSVDWPLEVHKQSRKNYSLSNFLYGNATPHPHNHTQFTPSTPHRLPWPHLWPPDTPTEATARGQRSHGAWGTPTSPYTIYAGPTVEARAVCATPTGSNRTYTKTTAHMPWDTPTSLIRPD